MKDLTQGPPQRHLIAMAVPIAAGMLFQTLYFLVDLYFVGRLGDAAIAGVGSAGNLSFLVMALSQVLGVGTVALISQAVGRKEQEAANLVFNQSMLLGVAALIACLVCGYAGSAGFARTLGSDAATAAAGLTYLQWYLPSLALQFVLVAMSSALRGTGIVKPAMAVQMITVLVNGQLASDPRHRGACRRRVRDDVRDFFIHLLGDTPLRRTGAGRLRRRYAGHAGDLPAGDGRGLLRGADRRPELRRPQIRARARHLLVRVVDERPAEDRKSTRLNS